MSKLLIFYFYGDCKCTFNMNDEYFLSTPNVSEKVKAFTSRVSKQLKEAYENSLEETLEKRGYVSIMVDYCDSDVLLQHFEIVTRCKECSRCMFFKKTESSPMISCTDPLSLETVDIIKRGFEYRSAFVDN